MLLLRSWQRTELRQNSHGVSAWSEGLTYRVRLAESRPAQYPSDWRAAASFHALQMLRRRRSIHSRIPHRAESCAGRCGRRRLQHRWWGGRTARIGCCCGGRAAGVGRHRRERLRWRWSVGWGAQSCRRSLNSFCTRWRGLWRARAA